MLPFRYNISPDQPESRAHFTPSGICAPFVTTAVPFQERSVRLDGPGASGAWRSLLRREPFRGNRGTRVCGPLGGFLNTLMKPRVENAKRKNESPLSVSCRSHLTFGTWWVFHTVGVLVWLFPIISPWKVFDLSTKRGILQMAAVTRQCFI